MMVLIAVLSAVLFFVYFPAFPDHDARVTGRPALLVCAALGMPCPSNPEFRASHSGYASATYILLGFGTGPQLHYPLSVTVYFTNATTNVTTARTVILWNDHTACLETNIFQPPRCVVS
jgi:hypothetical protein